jgi:hypothetical protein
VRVRFEASAPTIPQPVHTIRGPNVGTATSSGQRSTLSTAWWRQFQQETHAKLGDVAERCSAGWLVD